MVSVASRHLKKKRQWDLRYQCTGIEYCLVFFVTLQLRISNLSYLMSFQLSEDRRTADCLCVHIAFNAMDSMKQSWTNKVLSVVNGLRSLHSCCRRGADDACFIWCAIHILLWARQVMSRAKMSMDAVLAELNKRHAEILDANDDSLVAEAAVAEMKVQFFVCV